MKPRVICGCMADTYAHEGETIIEFSHIKDGVLISFVDAGPGLVIDVYRVDEEANVEVRFNGTSITRQGITYRGGPEQKEFVDEGGGYCPICGSGSLEGGSYDQDGSKTTHEISCNECGAEWLEQWELTGHTLVRGKQS